MLLITVPLTLPIILLFLVGFCMDLLYRLGEKVNFTFDVHLSEDGSYGSLRRVSLYLSYGWFHQGEGVKQTYWYSVHTLINSMGSMKKNIKKRYGYIKSDTYTS